MAKTPSIEEAWKEFLNGVHTGPRLERALLKRLPTSPRCKVCFAPFAGVGGALMRATGRRPFSKNPTYCNVCERWARKHRGGVEMEISFLFADVRGSTTVAERMSPVEFSRLMNRFYETATRILVKADAWIDKLVGDEVIGFFFPYLGRHAWVAVGAAQELLRAAGHAEGQTPWLPVGAGVHTGIAYVGVVGAEDTVTDVTALGDAVNVAARLASLAGAGEILVSDAAYPSAGLTETTYAHRQADLKGRAEPVGVHVLRVDAAGPVLSRARA